MLVAVLPLEEAQRASKMKHAAKHSTVPSAAQAAAAAAAARAAGSEASLSTEMIRLGESLLTHDEHQDRGIGGSAWHAV